MNLAKMIGELKAERERIEAAINALERLAVSSAKRKARSGDWKLAGRNEAAPAAEAASDREVPS
ncbi:MAG TPA: hypothetical protein VKX25_13560 [Bryobacteraceae bacterium]|nr:hypothetical protein [Bryobacteraceae bacterium]